MKTIITIENGKVSVLVDDGAASQKESTPISIGSVHINDDAFQPAGGGDSNETTDTYEPKSAVSHHKRPKMVETGTVPTKNGGVKRTCEICGDDISGSHKLAKTCAKKSCKAERARRYSRRHYQKHNGKPANIATEQTEKKVDYCKHCKAYTTHDTAHHPKQEPQFLPGYEKTPEELESWRPKPTNTEENAVKYADSNIPASDFTDPWDCEACRRRGHLCPLHQGMSDDGKEPSKQRKQPPAARKR